MSTAGLPGSTVQSFGQTNASENLEWANWRHKLSRNIYSLILKTTIVVKLQNAAVLYDTFSVYELKNNVHRSVSCRNSGAKSC